MFGPESSVFGVMEEGTHCLDGHNALTDAFFVAFSSSLVLIEVCLAAVGKDSMSRAWAGWCAPRCSHASQMSIMHTVH